MLAGTERERCVRTGKEREREREVRAVGKRDLALSQQSASDAL